MGEAGSLEGRLKALEGEWSGDEMLHPTPWAPGGSARGRWTFHLDPSGRYLVHDYTEERPDGARFDGHGVLAAAQDGGYLWFWFDSLGYIPTTPGTGSWEGDTLTLIRTSPRGSNRSVFALAGDRLTLDIAFRGTADPVDTPVMRGTFQRRR